MRTWRPTTTPTDRGHTRPRTGGFVAPGEGVKKRVENGKISEADGEAILRFEAAFDPENATETLPHDLYDSGRRTSHKTPGTRGAWLERLRFIATELELTEVEADDINEYTTEKVQSGNVGRKDSQILRGDATEVLSVSYGVRDSAAGDSHP